ncbi:MAG: hypothetical protein K9M82_08170 [Deltaproteobacteria bacterium]|nr:hypothetical protein [Deltaproteobacteria bacterium]
MDIAYLASSPNGDIPLSPDDLAAPFRITPEAAHPFLTLGGYLDGLRDFVLEGGGQTLCRILRSKSRRRILPGDIEALEVCTAKHGALYHVAGIGVRAGVERFRLCASTAVSARARQWLAREVETLEALHRRFGLPHLPVPLRFGETRCGSGQRGLSCLVLLVDWFEGFHEWHLGPAGEGEPSRVRIWDQTQGYHWATLREAESLFREAARILTRVFDPEGFRQIRSWHHAAGDFVVRPRKGRLDVRLTTARRYEPLPGLGPNEGLHPAVALVCFFLDLVLRLRLDREDGVGVFLWAGDDALEAAVDGFFTALSECGGSGAPLLEGDVEVAGLLRSFSSEELLTLYGPILQRFTDADPAERELVENRIEDHVTALHRVLLKVRG